MTAERPDPNRPLFADMDDDDETAGGGQTTQPSPSATDAQAIDSARVAAIPLGAPTAPDGDERDPVDRDVTDPRGH